MVRGSNSYLRELQRELIQLTTIKELYETVLRWSILVHSFLLRKAATSPLPRINQFLPKVRKRNIGNISSGCNQVSPLRGPGQIYSLLTEHWKCFGLLHLSQELQCRQWMHFWPKASSAPKLPAFCFMHGCMLEVEIFHSRCDSLPFPPSRSAA